MTGHSHPCSLQIKARAIAAFAMCAQFQVTRKSIPCRAFAERVSRAPKPQDWQTPLVRMVVRGKTEAVRTLLGHGADPSARQPDGHTLFEIARARGFDEIASLLGNST